MPPKASRVFSMYGKINTANTALWFQQVCNCRPWSASELSRYRSILWDTSSTYSAHAGKHFPKSNYLQLEKSPPSGTDRQAWECKAPCDLKRNDSFMQFIRWWEHTKVERSRKNHLWSQHPPGRSHAEDWQIPKSNEKRLSDFLFEIESINQLLTRYSHWLLTLYTTSLISTSSFPFSTKSPKNRASNTGEWKARYWNFSLL